MPSQDLAALYGLIATARRMISYDFFNLDTARMTLTIVPSTKESTKNKGDETMPTDEREYHMYQFTDTLEPVKAYRHKNPDGTLGGWVSATAHVAPTAYVGRNAEVYGRATIYENARITGNAIVRAEATVSTNAKVKSNAKIAGNAHLVDDVVISGSAYVAGNAFLSRNAKVYGRAHVAGNATLDNNARVYGNAIVVGYAKVLDKARVYDNAHMSDFSIAQGRSRIYGNALISDEPVFWEDSRVYGNAVVCAWVRTYGKTKIYGNARIVGPCRIRDCFIGGTAVIKREDVYEYMTILSSMELFDETPPNFIKQEHIAVLEAWKLTPIPNTFKVIQYTDINTDQTTQGKVGKVLRKAIPDTFTDQQVDEFTRWYREKVVTDVYTVVISDQKDEIVRAYGGNLAPNKEPRASSEKKNIYYSCMRGDAEQFASRPHHPSEVYASGEFKIIALYNEKGEIGGRTLVWMHHEKGPSRGPIYCVCEKTYEILKAEYEKMWAEVSTEPAPQKFNELGWDGAKLLKIEHNGSYVMTYLDMCQELVDEGDHWTCWSSNSSASYYAEQTCGMLNGNYCECCEEHTSQHLQYVDGRNVCECCLDEYYVYCDHEHEYIESEYAVPIQTRTGETYVHQDYAIYCELNDYYVHEEEANSLELVDHDGDVKDTIYYPDWDFPDGYSTVEIDGEVYIIEDDDYATYMGNNRNNNNEEEEEEAA